MIIWVDNILSFSNLDAGNDQIEADLKSKFEVNTIGNPSMILGIKLIQKENQILLSQTHFINSLLNKFGLENANPVTTPLDPNVNLDDDESEEDSNTQDNQASHSYATLIGSPMYLALRTRPDIVYAIDRLAQFTQEPKLKHWTAVKRVFHYLKGTRNYTLTYGGTGNLLNEIFNIFCDANWAGGSDRKSTSGYIITIAGGAVAWSSKKQASVALSTAEAEYISAMHAAKQVLWHHSLFRELKIELPTTSTIFSDNQATIAIVHHPEFHACTKHINISYHFLRDLVKSGTLNLVYANTHQNLADLFTKGLPRVTHQDLTYEIGVLPDQGGVLRSEIGD
jgi:Reverse transcriptase (RNA-dependent DNA polymerase)